MKKHKVFLILPVLLSLGMSEPGRVPDEVKDLYVVVVDSKGFEHKLRGLLCEGDPELRLKKGALKYRIPVRSIERVEVLEVGNSVRVKVKTRGGREEAFEVERRTKCTADSEAGSVTFYIDEVRSIRISEEVKR